MSYFCRTNSTLDIVMSILARHDCAISEYNIRKAIRLSEIRNIKNLFPIGIYEDMLTKCNVVFWVRGK